MVAVGVVLLVFSTADRRVAVLQVVRDLPAGTQLGAADLRSIELSTDPSLAVVKATDLAGVVGQYTKVRIVSVGCWHRAFSNQALSLLRVRQSLQSPFPSGELPAGLRERSQVQIVIPATGDDAPSPPVVGRVVGLPDAPDSVTGQLSVSFEVSAVDAVVVANATRVRVVLLDPGVDLSGTSP